MQVKICLDSILRLDILQQNAPILFMLDILRQNALSLSTLDILWQNALTLSMPTLIQESEEELESILREI